MYRKNRTTALFYDNLTYYHFVTRTHLLRISSALAPLTIRYYLCSGDFATKHNLYLQMSKGNMLLGYARGKVGSLVFTRSNGEQITRAYKPDPKNPQTRSQQEQRTRLANLVNVYRRGRLLLGHSFTNRKEGLSSYNAFISKNIQMPTVQLTRAQASAAASIIGPYVVSDGVLPPIQVNGGGVDAVTNIRVGNFTISDETTTVGQLAAAILANNADWQEGDQLTYVSVVQNGGVNGGEPFVQFSYLEIDLNPSDTTLLRSFVPSYAVSVKSGYIAHGEYIADGGYCWIHSRKAHTGALQASRQTLILTDTTLWNQFLSEAQTNAALNSYGSQKDDLLVPDGSGSSVDTSGLPSISSVSFNGSVLVNGSNFPITKMSASENYDVIVRGSNLKVSPDLNAEEILGLIWNKGKSGEVGLEPLEHYQFSNTEFTVKASPNADIDTTKGGSLTVQFTKEDGSMAEALFEFKATEAGSGQGGNPL